VQKLITSRLAENNEIEKRKITEICGWLGPTRRRSGLPRVVDP